MSKRISEAPSWLTTAHGTPRAHRDAQGSQFALLGIADGRHDDSLRLTKRGRRHHIL
jgi:hypothetical protein